MVWAFSFEENGAQLLVGLCGCALCMGVNTTCADTFVALRLSGQDVSSPIRKGFESKRTLTRHGPALHYTS